MKLNPNSKYLIQVYEKEIYGKPTIKNSNIIVGDFTNQPLSKWGEVLGDPVLANAIIDRLIHHSTIVKITGKSYRIKDKLIDIEQQVKNFEPNP